MSTSRLSNSLLRGGIAQRATVVCSVRSVPAYMRRPASSGPEPPRSQGAPAAAGEAKSILPIAAVGLGLGACFFYLMSRPQNAPKVAHATGNNLKELTARDSVSQADGRRMGTHKSD